MPRHLTHVPLRWADMDAYGHVNNVVYLRYLQEARVDMLFVHAARRGVKSLASGMLVAWHDIDYMAPLRFRPRPVRVETWVREVRNSMFTLGYEVLDADASAGTSADTAGERTIYALASTTLVPYDLLAGRPRRLTDEEKDELDGYLEPAEPTPGSGRKAWQRQAGQSEQSGQPVKAHVYECAVRFDDLDSYGHVNNVTFAEYLQEARIDFAQQYLHDATAAHEGSVVANQSIDYLAPVPSRSEPLRVHVWVTRIGESSFDLVYNVCDAERSYARATTVLVGYDMSTQLPRKLTPAERAALLPFAGAGADEVPAEAQAQTGAEQ